MSPKGEEAKGEEEHKGKGVALYSSEETCRAFSIVSLLRDGSVIEFPLSFRKKFNN